MLNEGSMVAIYRENFKIFLIFFAVFKDPNDQNTQEEGGVSLFLSKKRACAKLARHHLPPRHARLSLPLCTQVSCSTRPDTVRPYRDGPPCQVAVQAQHGPSCWDGIGHYARPTRPVNSTDYVMPGPDLQCRDSSRPAGMAVWPALCVTEMQANRLGEPRWTTQYPTMCFCC